MTSVTGGPRRTQALVLSVVMLLVFVVLIAIIEQRGVDVAGLTARHVTSTVAQRDSSKLTWTLALALAASGMGVGLIGGALGMGGGVLKMAGLVLLFEFDVFFARAVSVATMFIMAVSAVTHRGDEREGKIPKTPPAMIIAGALAVVVGALIGNSLRGAVVTHIFGYFVLFLGLSVLSQLIADPLELEAKEQDDAPRRRSGGIAGAIGACHGFVCGLLGISGGVISMPMQQTLMTLPVRTAISNSLHVTVVSAGIGSVLLIAMASSRGQFDWKLFAAVVASIGVGAAVGARIAAHVRGRIYTNILRVLAVGLCLMASLSILR